MVFVLDGCVCVCVLEGMAASLKDPGSIPGGGPKRFHDTFNFVFYIVGEYISCAADTYLATDLTY